MGDVRDDDSIHLIELAADLVSKYVTHNSVSAGDLPQLLSSAYEQLKSLARPAPPPAQREPFVPVRKSVTPDALICLECGVPLRSLKRHIAYAHHLTVDEYRAKWSLPSDYPLTAPNYSIARSRLAKQIGLGRTRHKRRSSTSA